MLKFTHIISYMRLFRQSLFLRGSLFDSSYQLNSLTRFGDFLNTNRFSVFVTPVLLQSTVLALVIVCLAVCHTHMLC